MSGVRVAASARIAKTALIQRDFGDHAVGGSISLAQGVTISEGVILATYGGTIAIDCDHGYEVSRELLAREILVDYRPRAGIRVSPHFYTADAELVRVVDEIRQILDSGAWLKHAGQRGTVT